MPSRPPTIDSFGPHRFLSNFYPSTIVVTYEYIYPTVEHAFQAAKTRKHQEKLISWLPPPLVQQNRLGQGVDLRPDWEHIKITVMRSLLRGSSCTVPRSHNPRGKLWATRGLYSH